MSFENMLNHKCDIYHLQKTEESPGWGLPGTVTFGYPAEPDITSQPCHFGVKSGVQVIVQNEPQTDYEAKIKLTFPINADIRYGDKIVNLENGYEYTAEIPVKVRNHHQFVMISRTSSQSAL